MGESFDKILNIFFPPRCIFCDSVMPINTVFCLCDACTANMPELADRQCEVCGAEIDAEHGEYVCIKCQTKQTYYLANVGCFKYEGKVKNAVLRFKFSNCVDYAKTMASLMTAQLLARYKAEDFDVVVPMPIGKKRLRKRGYNQSELLAKHIAKGLNLPMNSNSFFRKDATPQSKLSEKDRLKNLENVFYINNDDLKNKRILLIDDVYTTGSTMNTGSKELLKKAKAKEVYGLVFARRSL